MSEETKQKLSEYLDKKFSEMSLQQEKNLQKAIENLKSTSTSKEHKHTHSSNVDFECPECQQEYDKKVGDKAVSDFKKQVKNMKRPTLCEGEDCGEIYDAEEKEDCPTCHRHNY